MDSCKHLRFDGDDWICDGEFDPEFPERVVEPSLCCREICEDYEVKSENENE